ncbi:uncharacterized membrane protein YjjP (DUF1212 family) [Treponema rectale]|nr:hypothetical protein [Treponema rectale]MBB5218935.1 uncharacterized membrane protein YjjP (DUF1212 family) [Treponema rectale]
MALKIIIGSVIFITVGLIFCITGMILKTSSKQNAASKITGTIFYLIGAITLISGILGICFKNEITRTVLQFYALIYLVIISIVFFIITKLIKIKS